MCICTFLTLMLISPLRCKKPVIADKRFTIHDAPMVLTVHLKRFSPLGRKVAHHIQYDERLSLQSVMSEGQYGPSYSLYGVICHAGSGPNSGHYYAHVKGADGRWYEMNDESVSPTRPPTGLKSAYMLFYIREKGQALEAAVNRASVATRSVATGMKKRKVSDDEQDGEDTGVKTARPFIGPQLPPSTPGAASSSTIQPTPKAVDPQAEIIKKKIEAASKAKASQVLQGLSQYADDDDDESGIEDGALNEQQNSTPITQPSQSSPPGPPASSPVSPSSIPPINFYSSFNGKDKGNKRKSPDGDIDENRQQPQKSPFDSRSRPHSPHPHRLSRKPSFGGNPFNRMAGSNTLRQRDSTGYRPPTTYGRRRKPFAV